MQKGDTDDSNVFELHITLLQRTLGKRSMRIVIYQDIGDIQWELEAIVYQLMVEKGYYFHLHKNKITIAQLIEWWILDRLDHICHIPTIPRYTHAAPDYVANELWTRCRHLESRLWHSIRAPGIAEWTHANVELCRYDLKVELLGN